MCGIAGYFGLQKTSPELLDSMLATLKHRGPNNTSKFIDYPFVGGMTRLAINGIEDGNQPLFDESEDVVLFYNGEIYNSIALRHELSAKGYRFKTHSDGEVICHLYHEYGEKLFSYLDGMFAIALWIRSEKKLILARDLAGEKPLYYSDNNKTDTLVFASEIKSIRRSGLELTLNKQALWDFPTFLWIPEPETAYQEVQALPKGHYLVCHDGSRSLRRFENHSDCEDISDVDLIDYVHQSVKEAIEARLLSEVPVGCFLSSGLDSSIITTVASNKMPIRTYCIAFEDLNDPYHGKANEANEAQAYAKHLGTAHTTISVNAQTFYDLLDEFVWYADQPFAVSSGLGILAVSKEASRQGTKVLLSGDGADETFGGYSWYQYLNNPVQTGHSIENRGDVVSFQNFGMSVEERLSHMNAMSPENKAWAWHYYAHQEEKKSLFNTEFFSECLSSNRHFSTLGTKSSLKPVDFIRHDHDFYFPNEMLTKVDRMTMACSVESRAPFAAPKILSLAKKLSFNDMVSEKGELKSVLRQAFSKHLPESVLKRKKHGFNVPIDHWLKNEWSDLVKQTFSSDSMLSKNGMIHSQSYRVANQMLNDPNRLNGHSIFCLIMLNKWLEHEQSRNHC